MQRAQQPVRMAFAIFTDTICEGRIPAWHDEQGLPVTYVTEVEAQREIVDDLMERARQFIEGGREFWDVVTIEDYILPVEVWADGSITTEDGVRFGKAE